MLDPSLKHFQDDTTSKMNPPRILVSPTTRTWWYARLMNLLTYVCCIPEQKYDPLIYVSTTDLILQEMGVWETPVCELQLHFWTGGVEKIRVTASPCMGHGGSLFGALNQWKWGGCECQLVPLLPLPQHHQRPGRSVPGVSDRLQWWAK